MKRITDGILPLTDLVNHNDRRLEEINIFSSMLTEIKIFSQNLFV